MKDLFLKIKYYFLVQTSFSKKMTLSLCLGFFILGGSLVNLFDRIRDEKKYALMVHAFTQKADCKIYFNPNNKNYLIKK